MPRSGSSLTAWQLSVLQWIADACPASVLEGHAPRISAAALKRRGLVRVSGHGSTWRARITPAGRDHLTKALPADQPLGRAAGRPARVEAISSSGAASARTASPASPPAAGTGVSARLVAAVVAAGGVLRVPNEYHPGSIDYRQRANAAMRHGKVPPGKRLTVRRADSGELEIRLEDAIAGTQVEAVPVSVPSNVSRYHRVAARFREQRERHEISRAALPRALRIVHALATEAEQRGYQVANAEATKNSSGRLSWSGPNDGHLIISIHGHGQRLRIQEEGLPNRAAWEQSRAWRMSSLGRSSRQDYEPEPYDARASGRLRITLDSGYSREGRPSQWADRKSWSLEDKLPELLREIEVRTAEDAYRRLMAAQAVQERRLRWEEAMERAKAGLLEKHRADALRVQVRAWRDAQAIRDYCDAPEQASSPGEAVGEARGKEWIAWARDYADNLDPLRHPPQMPSDPEITPEGLKHFLDGWSPYGPG